MTKIPPPGAKRFLIVFNPLPNKPRKHLLQRLVLRLKQGGHDWHLCPTDENYGANRHYFTNHLHEFTDVIVLGGDGTFNLVVNLVQGSDARVGLIPAGTGNDFARAWYGKKRKDVSHILNTVLGDNVECISLGRVEFADKACSESGEAVRYFHNVMGMGFDAALAKSLRHSKGVFQGLGYLAAALQHIPFYREQACRIRYGETVLQYDNLITILANSPFFGNGMHIAPHADPKSSNLAIVRVEKFPFWTKMALIVRLLLGTHLSSTRVHSVTISNDVTIETTGLDLEADGEYLGHSPCTVSIKEHALLLKR